MSENVTELECHDPIWRSEGLEMAGWDGLGWVGETLFLLPVSVVFN